MRALNWNRGLFRFSAFSSFAWLFFLAVAIRPDQDIIWLSQSETVGVAQEIVSESDFAAMSVFEKLRHSISIDSIQHDREALHNLAEFSSLLLFPLIALAFMGFGLLWVIRGFGPKAQGGK